MAGFIGVIIGLTIAAIVITSVFIPTIKDANTTSFSASELALWGVVSLLAVVGMIYGVSRAFGMGSA